MQDRPTNPHPNSIFLARRRRQWGPVFFVLALCVLHVLAAGFYRLQAVAKNPICNQYLLAADLVPIIGPESFQEAVSFTFASAAPDGKIPLEIITVDSADAALIEAPGMCSVRPEQSSVEVRVCKHPDNPRTIRFLVRSPDPRARFQREGTAEVAPQSKLVIATLLSRASAPLKRTSTEPRGLKALPLPAPRPSVRMTGSAEPIRGDVATLTISGDNLAGEVLQLKLLPPETHFEPVPPFILTASEPLRRVDLRLIAGRQKPQGSFAVQAIVTAAGNDLIVPPITLEFYHRQWPNRSATARLLLVDTEFAPGPLAESIAQLVAWHHSQLADDGVVVIQPGRTVVIHSGEPLDVAGPQAFTGDHWKDAFSAVAAELDGGHRAIVVWPSPMLPTSGATQPVNVSHMDLLWCNGPDISAPQVNALVKEHIGAWWSSVPDPNLTDINTETGPERLRQEIEKILARE